MSGGPDLDHTSFAVRDATSWARLLRRTLGATPIAGEALTDFRYLLLYIGTAVAGGRIELIEPVAAGFLTRHLDRRGEGPHHLTFTVPDLRASVAEVRDLGATVAGEDYNRPSWQEAFIVPDAVHGLVIQLAQSDVTYPSPAELLASTHRDVDAYPSSAGATNRRWWASVWETDAEGAAVLGATHLGSTNLDLSRLLFGNVLGAEMFDHAEALEFRWDSGTVWVHARDEGGVIGIDMTGGPPGGLAIGPIALSDPTTKGRST